jgi:hypothetical protein
VRIWEKQVNKHVKHGTMLLKNFKIAYSLIYGQCSNAAHEGEAGVKTDI